MLIRLCGEIFGDKWHHNLSVVEELRTTLAVMCVWVEMD